MRIWTQCCRTFLSSNFEFLRPSRGQRSKPRGYIVNPTHLIQPNPTVLIRPDSISSAQQTDRQDLRSLRDGRSFIHITLPLLLFFSPAYIHTLQVRLFPQRNQSLDHHAHAPCPRPNLPLHFLCLSIAYYKAHVVDLQRRGADPRQCRCRCLFSYSRPVAETPKIQLHRQPKINTKIQINCLLPFQLKRSWGQMINSPA